MKVPPIQMARFYVEGNGRLPVQMRKSDATALPLVARDGFGADVISFGPGQCVERHVHPGAHILFVLEGEGELTYGDERWHLEEGLCYLVPPMVPHAIHADPDSREDLVLVAVGDDHRPVWSAERLEIVHKK